VSPAARAGAAQASTAIVTKIKQRAAIGKVCFEIIRARQRNNMV
jgi:hypothetical protein